MNKLEIFPYVGYDKLKFGMTQEETKKIDGVPPKIVIDNIMMQTYEHRNGSIKLTFERNKFTSIMIPQKPADCQAYIGEIDLFADGSLEKLKELYDYEDSKKGQFTLFKKLGIVLCGCGKKKAPEGKYVIAFKKNRLEFFTNYLNV